MDFELKYLSDSFPDFKKIIKRADDEYEDRAGDAFMDQDTPFSADQP